MRAVEQAPRNKKQKERRAKPARRSFAFHSPRPQLLKGPTKESMSSKPKPSDGDFVAAIRGSVADAFFGASPVVASALGIRSGATPRLCRAKGTFLLCLDRRGAWRGAAVERRRRATFRRSASGRATNGRARSASRFRRTPRSSPDCRHSACTAPHRAGEPRPDRTWRTRSRLPYA